MENKFLPKTIANTSFEQIKRAQQVRNLRLNVVLILAILTVSLFIRYSYIADSYIIDSNNNSNICIPQQTLHKQIHKYYNSLSLIKQQQTPWFQTITN